MQLFKTGEWKINTTKILNTRNKFSKYFIQGFLIYIFGAFDKLERTFRLRRVPSPCPWYFRWFSRHWRSLLPSFVCSSTTLFVPLSVHSIVCYSFFLFVPPFVALFVPLFVTLSSKACLCASRLPMDPSPTYVSRTKHRKKKERQKGKDRHGKHTLDPLLARICRISTPSGLPGTQPPSRLVSTLSLKPEWLPKGWNIRQQWKEWLGLVSVAMPSSIK